MCAWVNADQLPNAAGDEFNIVEVTDGTTQNVWRLRLDDDDIGGTDGNPQFIKILSGTSGVATATAAVTAGTWHHICGVSVGNSDRSVFLDGGNEGTNTDSRSDPTVTETAIASRTSTADFFDGAIDHVAIWNVDLTDGQIVELATGISPLLMRPDALVHYWRKMGRNSPELDVVGGLDMTVNSATTATTSPSIYEPLRMVLGAPSAAAPPAAPVGGALLLGVGR